MLDGTKYLKEKFLGGAMNYEDAVKLATEKHRGQYRKHSGEPYISHPLAVAGQFDDEDHKIVAVLHDTIEDTNLTIAELIDEHGMSPKLTDALAAITKRNGQTYIDFVLQVRQNLIATDVKIKDIEHNLLDLKNGNLKEKYLMALYILCD